MARPRTRDQTRQAQRERDRGKKRDPAPYLFVGCSAHTGERAVEACQPVARDAAVEIRGRCWHFWGGGIVALWQLAELVQPLAQGRESARVAALATTTNNNTARTQPFQCYPPSPPFPISVSSSRAPWRKFVHRPRSFAAAAEIAGGYPSAATRVRART